MSLWLDAIRSDRYFFCFAEKILAVIRSHVSSNPVYVFFATPKSFGPSVLRLLLASIFLYHGGQKAFGWFDGPGWSGTLVAWSGEGGMGFPAMVTIMVMLTELLIVIAMILGFLTRLATLGVIAITGGALYFVHAGQGIVASEFPYSLLMVAIALSFLGGGRFSLDRAISRQLLPTIGGY